jgi:hypothetical protein
MKSGAGIIFPNEEGRLRFMHIACGRDIATMLYAFEGV